MENDREATGSVKSDAEVAFDCVARLSRGSFSAGEGPARIVFLDSIDYLADGLRLCGDDGIVLSPPVDPVPDRVVVYEGALAEPGDELLVCDELYFHTQDYLATPFLAVAGPTVVRITGGHDYAAFLQDADLARETGVFVEQLLQPGVLLADLCALGTTHQCARSRRLYISGSGEVRSALGGRVLGRVLSAVDVLSGESDDAASAADQCLDGVVDRTVVQEGRGSRPWLSRYLRALDVLRGLRDAGRVGYRVSGFRERLVDGLPPGIEEQTDAPLLVWKGDEYLYCDSARELVALLGVDAARIAELLLVSASPEDAAVLAATHLGVNGDAVATVAGELESLGTASKGGSA